MTDTDPAPPPSASFATVHSIDEQTLRDRVADDARAAVGGGSTGPEARQDAYALRLFPDTVNPRLRAQMADSMYSCALSALAALRASLVAAPELHQDYSQHIGAAPAWLDAIAKRMQAHVPLATRAQCEEALLYLKPGNILVVENPFHVIVLTDNVRDVLEDIPDSLDYITSEGGLPEVDPKTGEHGMCIHSRRLRLQLTPAGRIQTGAVNHDGTVTWGRLGLYAISTGQLRSTDGL